MDPFAGNMQDPQSLHKYAYVHGDPANSIDPTGQFSIGVAIGIGIGITVTTIGVWSAFGPKVREPSFGESLIPVIGSAWSAIYHYQNGNYFLGTFNTALAASDWLLVRAMAGFVGKTLWKKGGQESAEVVYTKITDKGARAFSEAIENGVKPVYWGRTEGAVYGAAIENASIFRTWLNPFVQRNSTVQWTGEAAQLFGLHGAGGWYSGLKRLLGQYKSGLGDIKMLNVARQGDDFIVYTAELIPHQGTSP